MKKYIPLLTLMISCVVVSGCSNAKTHNSEPVRESIGVRDEKEYNMLYGEDEIIECLLNNMKNNKSSCSFNVESQDLIDTKAWMAKLPGMNNISIEYVKVANGAGINVYATMEYWDNYPIVRAVETNDLTNLTSKQTQLLRRYYDIIAQCTNSNMTAYQKEVAIHDYLVNNVEYDETKKLENTHSAYGAIIEGKSVCDGYAESFKTMMDMLGIECQVVIGEAAGEDHEWNMVCLDGAWYQVDVTWDDPVGKNGLGVSHKYFNVTDNELRRDHNWDQTKYTAAVGTKYDYYPTSNMMKVTTQSEFNSYVAQRILGRDTDIEILIYDRVNLEEALRSAGVSLTYNYNEIIRDKYSVYEISISYN